MGTDFVDRQRAVTVFVGLAKVLRLVVHDFLEGQLAVGIVVDLAEILRVDLIELLLAQDSVAIFILRDKGCRRIGGSLCRSG